MRRWPQFGFSVASRSTSVRISPCRLMAKTATWWRNSTFPHEAEGANDWVNSHQCARWMGDRAEPQTSGDSGLSAEDVGHT
jgi:hypothetical protein